MNDPRALAARLHPRLDAALAFPPEYSHALSNHLPMALHALAELGASEAQLDAFFAHYARRFERGGGANVDGYDSAREHIADQLRRNGRDATLREALPELWPGVAAAAFHGAIRTAHAVQSGHDGELAAALAYWRVRWQPTPVPDVATAAAMPAEAWGEALEDAAGGWHTMAGLIAERMAEAVETEAFGALASRLAVDDDTLAALHRWAAGLYASSGNFTVLHLVTGTRALRVLTPWMSDATDVLHIVAPAIAAAVLASGVRDRDPVAVPRLGWANAIERAIAQHDDHVIKLVHACVESAALHRDDDAIFLAAANRALRP